MSASATKSGAREAAPLPENRVWAEAVAAQQRWKRQSLARPRHWPNEREHVPGWYPPPLINEDRG